MLRLSCALVVVASVGAAPPIPGSTKATWAMDILRRVRIVECGLAVAKSMGGASYRTTPALQTEWARRLDFDEADFDHSHSITIPEFEKLMISTGLYVPETAVEPESDPFV